MAVNARAQITSRGIIEGRVFNADNNEPVPFASVVIWGTTTGTLTDEAGRFSLENVEPGFIKLGATSIGFENNITDEIYITNATKGYVEIALQENRVELEEVTVKAYPFRRQE